MDGRWSWSARGKLETWLARHSYGDNVYPLPGLDPQATSILVERILRRHHATHHLNNDVERSALQDLIALLGGYPLPLTVVLPVLATTPPSSVLNELRVGGEGADPVGLIRRAIEYSHRITAAIDRGLSNGRHEGLNN